MALSRLNKPADEPAAKVPAAAAQPGKMSAPQSTAASRGATAAPAAPKGPAGLPALFAKPVVLAPEREALLKDGLAQGLKFYENFNAARLKVAFDSFDAEMKTALYEVLFLLHVNDPKLKAHSFTATETQRVGGVIKERTYESTKDLYVAGAPHGVEGIDQLSPIFRQPFLDHVQQAFGIPVTGKSTFGFNPFVSVHSLGSIGTVGHKSRASDLDLQVQYELEPFLIDAQSHTDQTLKEALGREQLYYANRARAERKLPSSALQDPKVAPGLQQQAAQQVAKLYPNLHKYLVAGAGNYGEDLAGANGQALRTQLLHEMTQLLKRAARLTRGEELRTQEALVQERLKRIQEYLNVRFPNVELYLFSCSNDNYRLGHHGSTLTNKESSGSAYELILNYETLMPGIQMTPMVPTHFVYPKPVNNDAALYERITDYVRTGLLEMYAGVRPRMVNLGATPDMDLTYVARHSGAAYWEAFKASSGNLPKATLNLFRYEMLLDKRYLKTNIQIIKDPHVLDKLSSPRPEDVPEELEQMMDEGTGIPCWALLDLQDKFPLLLMDPWWQRYKALKIAFGEAEGVLGVEPDERRRISKIIDAAFALHVRISDVFTKPGDTRPFNTHREQVLIEFLKRAFPPISAKRKFLEHLFIGEVHAVNTFEKEMRELFKNSLRRVNSKIADMNIQGQSNQKEFEIWYHYYQANFEPAANVIPKTIMSHLKVPRGRLQVGYKVGEGWFFRSSQRESKVGKRFDTFGYLDHLPEDVMLRDKSSFLAGLADCVINGYYGILNEGTLKETRTVIEFDAKFMDLGNRTDNTLAYVRPDNMHRIINRMIEFFPARKYHYMDCIQKKREVVEVMLFLNLVKFGQLSALYRDNLTTWYCDEWEHPELFARAHNLRSTIKAQITAKPLHVTLAKFFKARGINPGTTALTCWVNPNSVDTGHSAQQAPLKEKELSEEFLRLVKHVHARPVPPPAAEAGAPAPQPQA